MQSVCGMSTHLAPCTSSSCITAYYTQMLCSMPHYCIACCSTVPVVHNCKVLVGQAVTCQVRYSKLRCVLLQVQMGFQDKWVSHHYVASCISILMFGVCHQSSLIVSLANMYICIRRHHSLLTLCPQQVYETQRAEDQLRGSVWPETGQPPLATSHLLHHWAHSSSIVQLQIPWWIQMTQDTPETAMTVTDNKLPHQKNHTLPSPPCESMLSEWHAATLWRRPGSARHILYTGLTFVSSWSWQGPRWQKIQEDTACHV